MSVAYYFKYILILARLYCHAAWHILDQTVYHYFYKLRKDEHVTSKDDISADVPKVQLGKTGVCIITGGCGSIGWASARKLLSRNWTVVIGARSSELSNIDNKENKIKTGKLICLHLDLSSLNSVTEFTQEFCNLNLPLHLLINNAGVMFSTDRCTSDGFEIHWAVNYLSHVLLSHLLLPQMMDGKKDKTYTLGGRIPHIVNVSSSVHTMADSRSMRSLFVHKTHKKLEYTPEEAYFNSKLAVVYGSFMLRKALLLGHYGIRVSCVHPGVVNTGLFKNVWWCRLFPWINRSMLISPSTAADHLLLVCMKTFYLANSDSSDKLTNNPNSAPLLGDSPSRTRQRNNTSILEVCDSTSGCSKQHHHPRRPVTSRSLIYSNSSLMTRLLVSMSLSDVSDSIPDSTEMYYDLSRPVALLSLKGKHYSMETLWKNTKNLLGDYTAVLD